MAPREEGVSIVTEPTTDEKIELLVRSVLEAVDARLDAVRHEIAGFAADVEQRHHHVLESVAALDARVSALADLHSSQRRRDLGDRCATR